MYTLCRRRSKHSKVHFRHFKSDLLFGQKFPTKETLYIKETRELKTTNNLLKFLTNNSVFSDFDPVYSLVEIEEKKLIQSGTLFDYFFFRTSVNDKQNKASSHQQQQSGSRKVLGATSD